MNLNDSKASNLPDMQISPVAIMDLKCVIPEPDKIEEDSLCNNGKNHQLPNKFNYGSVTPVQNTEGKFNEWQSINKGNLVFYLSLITLISG